MPIPQIAKKVVNECLQVREDEQVLIQSWNHTIDYADAIALEAQMAGATPLVTLSTDETFWGYLTKVPETYYGKTPKAFLATLDNVDAAVWLGGPEDPAGFKKVSGPKLAKAFTNEKPIMEKFRERKIRSLNLLVGQTTPQRAKTYGFNLASWRRNMDNAMSVDHNKISVLGQKLATRLESAQKVHIESANGTDIAFNITGRRAHVHDGIVDETDVSKGTFSESMPSGYVAIAPVEDSGEGTIVFDQAMALRGKMVKGLKWKFENGRLMSSEAKANLEAFTDIYNGSTGDKDRLGWFGIGINPKANFMGYYSDELVLGAVSLGIGDNKDLGGSNDTTFGHFQTLSKATVEADGSTILSEGKIKA